MHSYHIRQHRIHQARGLEEMLTNTIFISLACSRS